ncbi:MAG: MBOAT family protein, partial [Alphaproteobacteria bacterium]|nr:MBOAT family protein [Alphaproteobacteria bacterium]
MAFSSNFFVLAYLPAVLLLYFAGPRSARNAVLLVASLVFYAFDAGKLIWLLLISILLNHFAGQAIAHRSGTARRMVFSIAVVANLAFLLHYKYTAFLWSSVAPLLSMTGWQIGPPPSIDMPIGISFFTFQAISYIADIYAGRIKPARRLVDFGAYHSLFPQLIAGPIVRYVEVEKELHDRRSSLDDVADGLFRFCIGLGKKLILADTMGSVADSVFALPANELTAGVA